jgi:hypothetical protein
MVQKHRGMLKVWNVSLIALTFVLCIFGTYLTRSGVIQSVHSFGQSVIGTFFLTFLAIVTILSVILIVWRRNALKAEHELRECSVARGSSSPRTCAAGRHHARDTGWDYLPDHQRRVRTAGRDGGAELLQQGRRPAGAVGGRDDGVRPRPDLRGGGGQAAGGAA